MKRQWWTPFIMAVGLSCIGLASQVHAEDYMFTYSKLYSPLKHNLELQDQDVKVGLFFTNFATMQPCSIERAWMEKEQHHEVLNISDNGEVNVPMDRNLKSANPLVYIHTQKDARCDYSLVVLTKQPFVGEISHSKLQHTTTQMSAVLGALGGMFSSWFAPDIEGVTLEFKPNTINEVNLSNGKVITVNEQGKAILTLSDLNGGVSATLPIETQRVMPYIQK
ncbi:hypothetical protein A9264_03310 [Vibrio sp. UCD-FRSSP16_10]|uniref:DUF2987 domain-containing protein n=1 Tax=unclassified Vibrio TaxID=2614977 RepID=UPI000801AF43|nr:MULTISPECIES: DUF2987 domain-containing protein [unclassified Vibrio]OBT12178.1 hypothetical protein A9260_04760 [Vibrio sp. UCD-FRSSP16_30]OBT20509.1 hypothetical protein A9264_03310 [Vibrio sp. UCD-FRSSP16_10]